MNMKQSVLLLSLVILFFAFSFRSHQGNQESGLIKSDFMTGTVVGENLEKGEYETNKDPILANQWNRTARQNTRSGSSPVVVAPLVYEGYAESGKSNAFKLQKLSEGTRLTGYSLTSGNTYTSGVYYLALMVKLDKGSAGPFLTLDGAPSINFQRVGLSARRKGGSFSLGLLDKWGPEGRSSYSTATYQSDATHLLVLKYDMDAGTARVYVNPDLTGSEPEAATAEIDGLDLKRIRAITVRQNKTMSCEIGGLRFAKTWESALGKR